MLLLDTHVLLWLVRGELEREETLDAIAAAQNFGTPYVSAITAWELGVAERKRANRPELGMTSKVWFRQALQDAGAKLANITLAVAAEAALVPAITAGAIPATAF